MFIKFLKWLGVSVKIEHISYISEPLNYVVAFNLWPNTFVKRIAKDGKIEHTFGRYNAMRLTEKEAYSFCATAKRSGAIGAFKAVRIDIGDNQTVTPR